MTEEEFETFYKRLTDRDKLKFLAKHACSILFTNGECYAINKEEDLDKMIEQEFYQKMTGREK